MTLACSAIYLLLTIGAHPSNLLYRLTLLSALVSYGIVVFKSYGVRALLCACVCVQYGIGRLLMMDGWIFSDATTKLVIRATIGDG